MNVSRTVCEEGKGKAMERQWGEWFESIEKNTPILEIEEKSDSYYDTDGVFYSQVNYDIVSLSGCGFETVSHSLQM